MNGLVASYHMHIQLQQAYAVRCVFVRAHTRHHSFQFHAFHINCLGICSFRFLNKWTRTHHTQKKIGKISWHIRNTTEAKMISFRSKAAIVEGAKRKNKHENVRWVQVPKNWRHSCYLKRLTQKSSDNRERSLKHPSCPFRMKNYN